MKKLNQLIDCNIYLEVKGIKINSKEVKKGDLFVCIDMGTEDRHLYIDDAIERGACAIIAGRKIEEKQVPIIVVDNPNDALYDILVKFYDDPISKFKLIGVTGTDGKTTTSTILRDMTNGASIGTNGLIYDNVEYSLDNTTPSIEKVFKCFDKIAKSNKEYVFMEVSSEAYLTKRIPKLSFDIGIFTTITSEHIDKHKTFENYFDCKMQLLKNSKTAILNHDSVYFDKIKKVNPNYVTYGFVNSDITIKSFQLFVNKTTIEFSYKDKIYNIESPLTGEYNVYNLMGAILTMLQLDYAIDEIIERIKLIKKIPGRNEVIYNKEFTVMIDHAHTINAVKSILEFVSGFKKNNLIVVLGCAGGRYKGKREIIGKISFEHADKIIFTSDDPRTEDPNEIINDMIGDNHSDKEFYSIVDRKMALKKAISLAEKDDFVLVLGRGRDESMYMNGYVDIHNDYKELKNILNNMNKS